MYGLCDTETAEVTMSLGREDVNRKLHFSFIAKFFVLLLEILSQGSVFETSLAMIYGYRFVQAFLYGWWWWSCFVSE